MRCGLFLQFLKPNALPRAGRFGMSNMMARCLLLTLVLLFSPLASLCEAQPLTPSLPRDRRGPSRLSVERTERDRRGTQIPRGITPQPATPPLKGIHVIVLLGGVDWSEWAKISSQTIGSVPGLYRLLKEGDLAALRLPGAPRGEMRDEPAHGYIDLLAERSLAERSRVSPSILRAATTISTGQPMGWPSFTAPQIPLGATATLGVREAWSAGAPGYEEALPALAYARRVGVELGEPEALVNLAGSLWVKDEAERKAGTPHFGALGDAVRRSGARVLAFGSADTNIESERTLPLREWALLACNGQGAIAGGALSDGVLTRDPEAPFGVRQDGTAMLARVQTAIETRTGLVAIEWGDTRRAKLYAPLCSPDVAKSHKRLALERADFFLRGIMARLQKEDRLFLVSVPDLDTPNAQWIPFCYWQPLSSGRAVEGSLVAAGGEHAGVAPLESVFSTILARLPNAADMVPEGASPPLGSAGSPATSNYRVNRLMSLQAGWAWLDAARTIAHSIWAIFFLVSIIILVVLLTQATPTARFGQVTETPTGLLSSSQNWARAWWSATMFLPLLMWLGGLCIEATWRFGALPGATSATPVPVGWRLPLSLVLIAGMIVGLAGLARTWFARARLRGVRVGLIYLLLTIVGLLVGGFALPWNSLLGTPILEGSPARAGDIWALLLISATLLGIGGMAQPSQRTLAQLAEEIPRRLRSSYDDEDEAVTRPSRRIINLRPAVIWMTAVVLLISLAPLGHNAAAGFVAVLGFGTTWLRLWLEREERPQRLRRRRWVVAAALAIGIFLLLPQGAPGIENALADWWPRWLDTWSDWWWNAALLATALGAGAFLTSARIALRNYLRVRYAMRAMLDGAIVAAAAALLIFGSFGPPLIALYTLGAVIFQVLGAPSTSSETVPV